MTKYSYSDNDMNKWDLHLFIAKSVVIGTEYMLKHGNGYPSQFGRLGEKRGVAKWNRILQKIHDGFQIYYKQGGEFYEWKRKKEPPHKPLIKNPNGTWSFPPTPPGFKFVIMNPPPQTASFRVR